MHDTLWQLRSGLEGGTVQTFAYGVASDHKLSGTTWLVRNSNTGGNAEISFDFGAAGDVALVWHAAVISVPPAWQERNGPGCRRPSTTWP